VSRPAAAPTDADLQEETVGVLADLIRFDTVNPPGAEAPAIEYVHGILEAAGFECAVLAAEAGRPNLVARLAGSEEGPVLGYLGHVDTVLATPGEWTHDPWAGELADGFVWGRGALDMKSQVAAEVVAAAALARGGWRPARGELKVLCVADEEAGGALGAQFLTEQHPDAVRCDLLLNEGGGEVMEYRGQRLYGVCCGEKGVFRFTLSVDGVAGHASIPRMGDNALLKLAPLLARLGERQPDWDITPEPAALLRALHEDADDPGAALERLRETDPFLALLVEPMLGVTVTPTKASASEKINVIPSRASLGVDCRVPPGLGEAEARARIEELLGPDGYRIEFHEPVVGNRSPMESHFMEAIGEWVAEHDPGARIVPTILPGFTDSRWFRVAFPDCVAYGFFPQKHMTLHDCAPLIHGADERIDVRDLGYAASFFRDVALRMLGGSG
jgi:acetylornithine deacetylase/succinyl-diaminopimelate desuccinylase-like protein